MPAVINPSIYKTPRGCLPCHRMTTAVSPILPSPCPLTSMTRCWRPAATVDYTSSTINPFCSFTNEYRISCIRIWIIKMKFENSNFVQHPLLRALINKFSYKDFTFILVRMISLVSRSMTSSSRPDESTGSTKKFVAVICLLLTTYINQQS